jgi:hypothetical protein
VRQRRRGAWPFLPRLHSSLPPRRRTQERGKPQVGWWNAHRGRAWPQVIHSQSRQREGKRIHNTPGLGDRAQLAMWPASNGRHRACRVTGRGKRGFSPSESAFRVGCLQRSVARRACQPAPGYPIACQHDQRRAARSQGRKKVKKKWAGATWVAVR